MFIFGQVVLVDLPGGKILIYVGIEWFVRIIFKLLKHAKDIDVSQEFIGVSFKAFRIINNFLGGL